jgi:hypothetical protein
MKKLLAVFFILACGCVWAQDFGFGFDDDSESSSSSSPASKASVKAGGDITVEISPYVRDFEQEDAQEFPFWDMISGTLNFTAGAPNIEAYAAVNLNADAIKEIWEKNLKLKDSTYTPLILDEVYLKAFIGQVNIEAGLRKLAWGKADSPGPLDVTNPMDYSDLRNITDVKSIKIARPMLHVTWNTGTFSKLEGVFIPNFAGHRFAEEGRWQPYQYKNMRKTIEEEISSKAEEKFKPILFSHPELYPLFNEIKENMGSSFNEDSITYPSTGTLEYFQGGLRFTTTAGPADIGFQYYYGNFFRPSFTVSGIDEFLDSILIDIMSGSQNPGNRDLISPEMKYNRYHQIGLDYAQVLLGFNVRAEAAFHLTEDRSGDDGSVQNPFIGWSAGFDRDLFLGLNLNIQCNETVRLFNDKIGDDPLLDAEAGTKAVSSRLTARLSKKFLMDRLESSATVIWDIENTDFYIIPALVWTEGNMSWNLSGGIFKGKETGDFGQYWRNNFVKFGITYSF